MAKTLSTTFIKNLRRVAQDTVNFIDKREFDHALECAEKYGDYQLTAQYLRDLEDQETENEEVAGWLAE